MPFDEIILYTAPKAKKVVEKSFSELNVISNDNLFSLGRSTVHIPVSPFISLNSKFLLHITTKIKRNKLILNYHGDLFNETLLKLKSSFKLDIVSIPTCIMLPWLLNSSDKLIVNSYSLEQIIKKRYNIKSSTVVPNGIENYWFSKEYEAMEKNNKVIEIFFHGRLSMEKGIDLLLRGLYSFISNNSFLQNKIMLYIAGDGPQKKDLINICNKLGLNRNVVFLGNVDKKLIKSYLKKVDGAIYPSIWDNFPLSFLEAFACAECPVYFSEKAGIFDFTIKDGYKLNSFQPTAQNISQIIRDIYEQTGGQQIIASQKKFANKYIWKNVINYYIDIYNEIVNRDQSYDTKN